MTLQDDLTFFFFNDTATTEIYTLSLHDALPILRTLQPKRRTAQDRGSIWTFSPCEAGRRAASPSSGRRETYIVRRPRSEEHTSELQSRQYLVCRLLLEKKK